jgi:hypothetical protein
MSERERPEATADAALPEPGDQPPPKDRPPGAEALPAAQDQPPAFMYGSSAAGTARDGVVPGPVERARSVTPAVSDGPVGEDATG